MKNRYYWLPFIAIIMAASAHAQPTALNIEGLTGNVKRVDEKRAAVQVKNGVAREKPDDSEKAYVFDEKARLTYESRSGMYPYERNCIYEHEKNEEIRKCRSQSNPPFTKPGNEPRPSFSASVFQYNTLENSISEDTYTSLGSSGPLIELDNLGQRYKYFFNATNGMTKRVVLASDGDEVMTYEYFYRGDAPAANMVLSTSGRALQFVKYTYELDGKGNWIKRTAETTSVDPRQPVKTDITYRKISYYKN